MTPAEVAVRLKVPRRYVYWLTETGRIPFTKEGRSLCLDRADVEAYAEAHGVGVPAKPTPQPQPRVILTREQIQEAAAIRKARRASELARNGR